MKQNTYLLGEISGIEKRVRKKWNISKQLPFGNQGGGWWIPASHILQATAAVLEVTTNHCIIPNHIQAGDSPYQVAGPLRTPRWLAMQAQTNSSISLIIKKPH